MPHPQRVLQAQTTRACIETCKDILTTGFVTLPPAARPDEEYRRTKLAGSE